MRMEFGFHASGGGKIEALPGKVAALGGECFQFFSRNPYGGVVKDWEQSKVEKFIAENRHWKIKNYYIHSPYFINLASKNETIFSNSIEAIKLDLKRIKAIQGQFVNTHLGSAKDFIGEEGFPEISYDRVLEGIRAIIGREKEVPLILEIAAGAGSILGSTLDEIAFFLKKCPALRGFCVDTAHAFASGYDLRSEKGVNDFFEEVEDKIGLEKLKLIHLNDSAGTLGSRMDRHRHLGEGEIGLLAFEKIVDYFKVRDYNISMILETPTEEGLKIDLELLKKFRDKS